MGTLFRIVLYAPDVQAAKAAFRAAFDAVRRLDEALSDYREDSELNRFCRAPAGVAVPLSAELFEVLSLAQTIAKKTDGAFDVTLGPVIRLWRQAREGKQLPSEAQRREALARCGWRKLHLDAQTGVLEAPGMQLDLGGIAKGFAADKALEVLSRQGIPAALVGASGDIRVHAAPPDKPGWKVGAQGRTLILRDRAVSTSGDAEQFLEVHGIRYSHIVDPRTGLGLTERLTATVLAPSSAQADGWATAVSVLGSERGVAIVGSEQAIEALAVRATQEGPEELATAGFP